MTMGDRLKKARKDAGFTQATLAKVSGVDQARISGLEIGTQRSSVYLIKICVALGVDPIYIETGEAGDSEPSELTPLDKQLLDLLHQLSDDERAREIAFMQKLVAMRSKL
jgi:transcriptional regulator with XRE-family HTH domain